MPTAFITGIAGQDGSYLAEFLVKKGYQVYGTCRNKSNLPAYVADCAADIFEVDLGTPGGLTEIVNNIQPNEIYHLAAHHFSSQKDGNSKNSFVPFNAVNLMAANEMLEHINKSNPACRFFYASSCQVYGHAVQVPQTEATPYAADSFYAIAKAAGGDLCRFYRNRLGVHASVGILYNHESPRRGAGFVTTEIADAAARVAAGHANVTLELRDMDAIVDWGAARDYVEAMWLTLQQPQGDDYHFASGIARTVRDFARVAFNHVGKQFEQYVFQVQPPPLQRRNPYVGNPHKLYTQCKWTPAVSFEEMIGEMIDSKIKIYSLVQ